jgi:hypothetical protein
MWVNLYFSLQIQQLISNFWFLFLSKSPFYIWNLFLFCFLVSITLYTLLLNLFLVSFPDIKLLFNYSFRLA